MTPSRLAALFITLLVLLLTACTSIFADAPPTPTLLSILPTATSLPATQPAAPTATLQPTATPQPTATAKPSATTEPSSTPAPTATAESTLTPSPTFEPTATSDPYRGYSIDSLRADTYGQEGEIETIALLEETPGFTRYRIRYPSDGINIDGFMNVPRGDGPFPVVIVNHGYMPRGSYDLLTYTAKYADALADAGYLAIHPSFRNHRGSDSGPNAHRIGYARDVMHLIPMVRRLPQADGAPVGLWGHSMGGGITLRVLTLSDQVAAAVVYGSMSGDEAQNTEAIMRWRGEDRNDEPTTDLPFMPSETGIYAVMSPANYYRYVTAPVAIHHGVLDDVVPFAWSEQLAGALTEAGVPHEFFAYETQYHNFTGDGLSLLNQRVIDFFDRHMK